MSDNSNFGSFSAPLHVAYCMSSWGIPLLLETTPVRYEMLPTSTVIGQKSVGGMCAGRVAKPTSSFESLTADFATSRPHPVRQYSGNDRHALSPIGTFK